ncbi:antistasin-like [Physella acuta]|uniref:antistasin-like n=1 Tax=Physella acuta TaxID=109671 RepID=UPI0027DDFC4E|nr:antistasin-like [Physella acuta]
MSTWFVLLVAVLSCGTLAESQVPQISRCLLACLDDQVLDARACRCVNRNTTACPRRMCGRRWPLCEVYKVDASGCQTCECQCVPPVCPPTCRGAVEYHTNSYGCRLCRCKRACPGHCDLHCPHGFELDPSGCPACRCRERVCPPVCAIACLNGNVLDENGCPTCKCQG